MLAIHWDESHRVLRDELRRWVARHLAPHVEAWEEGGGFPRSLYRDAGAAGVLGVGWPEELGGSGGDIFHRLVVVEELVRSGSMGTAMGLGSHGIALPPILAAGTREQAERWVPPVLRGERVAALAVTEPDAGSDVAAIRCRAVRRGDAYVVDGTKTFITSGARADLVTVAVRTGGPGRGGISLLVVERGMPGFRAGPPMRKLGWWASDTAELVFEGCRVPVSHRIGPEGSGFGVLMANFVTERLLLAAAAVAAARLALDLTLEHVRRRQAFGRPIGAFQVVRHRLAEMATDEAQARAFVSSVAERLRRGEEVTAAVAMAKNAAVAACSRVTDAAVQLHGGMGAMRECPVERLYRDARILPIGGGTTEIMNEVIARAGGLAPGD